MVLAIFIYKNVLGAALSLPFLVTIETKMKIYIFLFLFFPEGLIQN